MALELFNLTLRNDAGNRVVMTRKSGTKLRVYSAEAAEKDPTQKEPIWFRNIEQVRKDDVVAYDNAWWYADECAVFRAREWRTVF